MIFPTFPHDLRISRYEGSEENLVPGSAENQAGQTGKKAEKVRAPEIFMGFEIIEIRKGEK